MTEDNVPVAREALKEAGYSTEDADKKIILIPNSLEWLGGPSAPQDPAVASLTKIEELLKLGSLDHEERFDGYLSDETVYLCYSSGTTGKPKGVEARTPFVL